MKTMITIEENDRGVWAVRCGKRYQGELCQDEVLFVVASILLRGVEKTLRTEDEHLAARMGRRSAVALT